ncbi:MAG TPA: hypothetical protein ENH32_06050 [Proteobacteria bacterium]|nr:hypothetical protein BMS3Abin14_00340 [bacterium BMS3Abin14]HDL53520.1 hypothetical protein [Pseudomonadota bacterium]
MDELFSTLSKSGKYIFTAADLLLIVAASFFASQIILTALIHPGTESVVRSGAVALIEGPSRKSHGGDVDAAAVLDRNLFGSRISQVPSGGNETVVLQGGLPESALPLQLLGTVVSVRGGRSFAIIQNTSTKEQQLYFAGDPVVEGVTLVSVDRNRAILMRNGHREVLEKATDRVAAPPARRPGARVIRPGIAKRATGITVRKVAANSYVMDRREVDGVLKDFSKLLTQIRLVPHFSNGKADGFKVFNIRPNSLFMKLGMVNGDILKRVNGLEISGPEQALQMFQQLRDENRITLVIERFRKNLTLQYEIR